MTVIDISERYITIADAARLYDFKSPISVRLFLGTRDDAPTAYRLGHYKMMLDRAEVVVHAAKVKTEGGARQCRAKRKAA